MMSKEGFGGPEKSRLEKGTRMSPETLKLNAKLLPLIKEHGKIPILKFIEQKSLGNIAPIVVERWSADKHTPPEPDQNDIMATLESFTPDQLPAPDERTTELERVKPSLPVSFYSSERAVKRQSKRQKTIAESRQKVELLKEKLIERLKKEGKEPPKFFEE